MFVKDGHSNLRKVNYSYEIIALAEFSLFQVTKMLQRNKIFADQTRFSGRDIVSGSVLIGALWPSPDDFWGYGCP